MGSSSNHAALILRAAYSYASLGWHLLPVHGLVNGECTCGRKHPGSEERSKGKHPILSDWGQQATTHEEVLEEWFSERYKQANLGVVLGPMSGICDIEFDDEAGRETAERMLGGLITPTYQSGRSIHRIVRWSAHLPEVPKITGAVVGGLEVRIGGGGRQTMSVVPPSSHWSGCDYRWLPGLSPDECDVAPFPDQLLARIVNGEQEPAERPSYVLPNGATRARQVLVLEQIPEGERNTSLHAFACREAVRSPDLTLPREESDLREKVWAANLAKCSPPLTEEEVAAIVASAIKWAKNQPNTPTHERINSGASLNGHAVANTPAAPGIAQSSQVESTDASEPRRSSGVGSGLHGHGLRSVGSVWTPGDWQLTVVLGDPPVYRLTVPAWSDLVGDGEGHITMSADEFMDPGKMARAVLLATKTVILETKPRLWPALWCGSKDQEGLRSQLMDRCHTEAPAVTDLAYYATAEYLLEKMDSAEVLEDDELISENGTQVYAIDLGDERREWVLRWTQFWRRSIEQGLTTLEGAKALARRMGWGDSRYAIRRDKGGRRRRVLVLGEADHARLQDLLRLGADGSAATRNEAQMKNPF